jgi:hypothetical protein
MKVTKKILSEKFQENMIIEIFLLSRLMEK